MSILAMYVTSFSSISFLGNGEYWSQKNLEWAHPFHYLKHFATLIEQNILKHSNYCLDSLAIRLSLRTLNTLYQKTDHADYRVSMYNNGEKTTYITYDLTLSLSHCNIQ